MTTMAEPKTWPEHPIIALHAAEPHLTRKEVAERLGITRQRVEQLCKKHGLVFAPPFKPRPCEHCGKPLGRASRLHLSCIRDRAAQKLVTLICKTCGQTFRRSPYYIKSLLSHPYYPGAPSFCSKECRDHRRGPHEIQCAVCGVTFEGTPDKRWRARKRRRVYCPPCWSVKRVTNLAEMRAKRWQKVPA